MNKRPFKTNLTISTLKVTIIKKRSSQNEFICLALCFFDFIEKID